MASGSDIPKIGSKLTNAAVSQAQCAIGPREGGAQALRTTNAETILASRALEPQLRSYSS